jgi:hypothetical protein
MLRDSLATPATEEEVPQFTAGLERNQADMLVPRRSGFNARLHASVALHPEARRACVLPLSCLHPALDVSPCRRSGTALDSMWLLTRERTVVIYVLRDPEFIYRAIAGNHYVEPEWMTLGEPSSNPQRELRWTKTAYDPVMRTWIISAIRPFDLNDARLGTIGHDLFPDELVQRLVGADRLPGTEHFLIDDEGNPIIAGKWQAALEANRRQDQRGRCRARHCAAPSVRGLCRSRRRDDAAAGLRRPRPCHHQGADRASRGPDPRRHPAGPRRDDDPGTAPAGAMRWKLSRKDRADCLTAASHIA